MKCPRCGEPEHPDQCTVEAHPFKRLDHVGLPRDPAPRFFIDHGVIHDRVTGKHVSTNPDSVFEDGVEACCNLLNELNKK